MPATTPVRVDERVHARAEAVAPTMSRSTAQQISHWARIGAECEMSDDVSHRDIARVLACKSHYDGLNSREQAIVRTEWAECTEQRRQALNLAVVFAAEGRPYIALDDEGNVVRVDP